MIYTLQPSHTRQTTVAPPPPLTFGEALVGIGLTAGLLLLLDHLCSPSRPARRALRAVDRDYVSQRDGWRCSYCGGRVTRRTRHIDHSRSLANGGTDHVNNLCLACAACNLSKGSLNARQFRLA